MPNWKKVIVSGSSANLYELNVDSSITASIVSASQFTGSLFGTASWAVSSSCALFAITASYVETAQTASYVLQAISASYALISSNSVSSSYALSASYADNVPATASYALQALSSSYAATASHADVFTVGGSQMMYSNTPSTSAGNNGIFATSTGSFAGAFYQYTLYSGSNARSENANVVWTATTSSYTNYSTIDVGNTSGVVGSVVITGGQVQLNILTPTAGWTVRAVATFV